MAFRLKLVPAQTNFNFFRWQWLTTGLSVLLSVASVVLLLTMGLNFGIDFRGGTTIRAEATQPIDVAAYRSALTPLNLGDTTITEVFDPGFRADQHVAQIRIGAQDTTESVTPETINAVQDALREVEPSLSFPSVESVGPKVSGELIKTAIYAVLASLVGISIYIWMRFEWQFAVGALLSLGHDAVLVLGLFSLLQLKFDLTTIAAVLTVVGYSINDTVVVFDRLRENLIKYKTRPLKDLMNLSVNETLGRTVMTSGTTVLVLAILLVLGGDVIREFTLAILVGIVIGTYSSVYMANSVVLWLGVKRDWTKKKPNADSPFSGAEESP